MSTKGVVYITIGDAYLLPIVTSIYTLRQHYEGDIRICSDFSSDLVTTVLGHLVSDAGVTTQTVTIDPAYPMPVFLLKSQLPSLITVFDSFLYLDADTLVVSDPTSIIPELEDDRIILTQRSNWTTQTVQSMSWLKMLTAQGLLHNERLGVLIAGNYKCVNMGVFALSKNCEVTAVWEKTTRGFAFSKTNLNDEIAMQVLYPDYPYNVLDDRYNCDPNTTRRSPETVVVWHCASCSYGMPKTRDLYFQTVAALWEDNFAHIRDWYPGNFDLLLPPPP
jgi:hypothetical protein